jgi:hypothetical protein
MSTHLACAAGREGAMSLRVPEHILQILAPRVF